MRILRCIGAVALCLAMPACATVLTPERCEVAIRAADTVQDIANVLVARGVEPERARQVADAVALGQLALSAACAQAGLGGGTTAGSLPAPPSTAPG